MTSDGGECEPHASGEVLADAVISGSCAAILSTVPSHSSSCHNFQSKEVRGQRTATTPVLSHQGSKCLQVPAADSPHNLRADPWALFAAGEVRVTYSPASEKGVSREEELGHFYVSSWLHPQAHPASQMDSFPITAV